MYILRCANDTYYTGSTNDLEKRLEEHHLGIGANYTHKHRPVKLVYFEEFVSLEDAFQREKQVQNWSQKKKEALIKRNIQQLKAFSASRKKPADVTNSQELIKADPPAPRPSTGSGTRLSGRARRP